MKIRKRVLVGTYYLDHVGGSELYAVDLLRELHRREDVEVEFFAVVRGKLADYLVNEVGIPFRSTDRYDLIIAAHNVTVDILRKETKGTIVQVCHGTIADLELPSPHADIHVGISQEVCDSLSEKGCPNKLVLNGLDLQQKRPIKLPNPALKVVLSLCQSDEANQLLAKACAKKGLEFLLFNKHRNPTFHIEREINNADLVVGIGRSVFDAMACGRPCVVFDQRDYNGNRGDGYLYPELFDAFIQHNCSGRYRNQAFSEADLLREFDRYDPDDGARLRRIAEDKLDVVAMADALLSMENHISWKTRLMKSKRVARKRMKRLRKSINKRLKKWF